MTLKILLPTNIDLPGLSLGTDQEPVIAVPYNVREDLPPEHRDADVLVSWANPMSRLRDTATALRQVRWVQTLAAGPDAVLNAGFHPDVLITSGRSLHDGPVAEHTLALVLAAARRLDLTTLAQAERRWPRELGGLHQPADNTARFSTLRGAHVVIWGFGSIASTLAPLLSAFGARVTGIARSAGERDGYPIVTAADLPDVLPTADVLISLLPATAATTNALNADILALLPPTAWIVNVGRGVTVDEDALVSALQAGRIGGAALDVTRIEPLPQDSALWDTPNVLLTPHAAGGRPLGAGALIEENVAAFLAGRPLRNVVERS